MIYFIQDVSGPIKIGYTRDADTLPGRLRHLQTGSCTEHKFLGSLSSGQKDMERWIHWKLRHDWIRGEWHAPVPILVDCAHDPETAKERLEDYDLTERDIAPIRARKDILSSMFCVACRGWMKKGEESALVGGVPVHESCALSPPDEHFVHNLKSVGICLMCDGTIFEGEKDGKALRHKTCPPTPRLKKNDLDKKLRRGPTGTRYKKLSAKARLKVIDRIQKEADGGDLTIRYDPSVLLDV